MASLGALFGLTLETGLVFLPALAYLIYTDTQGTGAFAHSGYRLDILMVGAGLVTTVPLLLFASAAQHIPLTMVGILQYIAPTLQFLIGVLVFKEPFSGARLVGFSMVWVALVLFWGEGVMILLTQGKALPAS